jgi:hypothetical protein
VELSNDLEEIWRPDLIICSNGALNYSMKNNSILTSNPLNFTECLSAVSVIRNIFPQICYAAQVGLEFRCDHAFYEWRKSRIYYEVIKCETDASLFETEIGVAKVF